MNTPGTLLPPNASSLERALERVSTAVERIPVPLPDVIDPALCAPALLPFLAYHFSVDRWDADWPVATKRAAVAGSIAAHRRKGTPAVVDAVLATFDALLRQVEWHETNPRGPANTFEILLPLDGAGGDRASAATAEAIVREVTRVKRLSQHFILVQDLRASSIAYAIAAGRTAGFNRHDATCLADPAPIWGTYLQTEQGEPFANEAGVLLEETA